MTGEESVQTLARTRSFFAEFVQVFGKTGDLGAALDWAMEPDCRVYFGNGDVGGRAASQHHAADNLLALRDMTAEFEHVSVFGDRIVVQYWMSGTVGEGVLRMPVGAQYRFRGASVGRVSERARLSEVWSYSNVSFGFEHPPSGVQLAAPPPDSAVTAEDARALYETWTRRASAGDDYVSAVASTLAPDGVVHFGNGDTGDAEYLRQFFRGIVQGLPDLSLTIEHVLVGDARLVVQFLMWGTHLGVLGSREPTGRVLPSRGMLVGRPNGHGQAAELWFYLSPAYALLHPPGTGMASDAVASRKPQ